MNRRHPLPAEVYSLVEQTPATVLLECNKAGISETCSQLFIAPVRVCRADTAAEIPQLFAEIESAVAAGLTAAGFFSYECGICFEPKSKMRERRGDEPLAWFGIYGRSYRFDHATGNFIDGDPPDRAQFAAHEGADEVQVDATLALSEQRFAERIAAIHELIRSGDVYQLNFTVPMDVRVRGSLATLYARLRRRQPVEYGAFLHWQQGRTLLSFSPELFFRVEEVCGGRRITTRPMKGTARRGRTTREDRAHAEWLRNDPKNRAENLMIVDLERNDLGRLAKLGSVHVESLFAVERYPTLWQMTSTVNAELRPDVGFYDIFRALFPCGSITGAPKVRAMQLLAELEEQPRGVYTGAIGFFSPRQTVFNVAIRTLEMDSKQGTMSVGSGIVIDSNAAEEYQECLLKADFLTLGSRTVPGSPQLPEKFFLIETMLWDGGYPLIELHLDRLMDSADYFAYPCERAAIKVALEARAPEFTHAEPRLPRRVRLLVDGDGIPQIADEILNPTRDEMRISRLRIADERTDPTDKWLYHKTTQRVLYALAYKQAIESGFDDVLFLNLQGEVTEGAISNIFIEEEGRLLTPPIECGLLGGVYRRHLLETRPNVEERVLSLDDLRRADAIYLTNAVRGMRRVEIDWPAT
jgi:para-aminobenzoate synthetase/4-amino-4-deoxychorismate lyase